jgi:hypothetical protein
MLIDGQSFPMRRGENRLTGTATHSQGDMRSNPRRTELRTTAPPDFRLGREIVRSAGPSTTEAARTYGQGQGRLTISPAITGWPDLDPASGIATGLGSDPRPSSVHPTDTLLRKGQFMANTAIPDGKVNAKPCGAVAGCKQQARLAVLLGARHRGERAMHNDIRAITPVLRSRGFCDDDILKLNKADLERNEVLEFLRTAANRASTWKDGEVILYVTGHGSYTGETIEEARLAVQLSGGPTPVTGAAIFWDEIFATLKLPAGVILTLLADT